MTRLALALLLMAPPALAFEANKAEIDAFVMADGNGDGLLNRAEFETFVRGMAATGQPTAKQIRFFKAYGFAFGIADKNKDGVVSPQEMRSADDLHRAGEGPASN